MNIEEIIQEFDANKEMAIHEFIENMKEEAFEKFKEMTFKNLKLSDESVKKLIAGAFKVGWNSCMDVIKASFDVEFKPEVKEEYIQQITDALAAMNNEETASL